MASEVKGGDSAMDTQQDRINKLSILDSSCTSIIKCTKTVFTQTKSLLTRDNRFLITVSGANVRILSCKTGELYGRFEEHKTAICNIYLTDQQDEVITASKDGIIIFWNCKHCSINKTVKTAFTKIFKCLYSIGSPHAYVIRERSQNISSQWKSWCDDIRGLNNFSIPRCFSPPVFSDAEVELHHFCDASENDGYGVSSYFRFINPEGIIHCCFLFDKFDHQAPFLEVLWLTCFRVKGKNELHTWLTKIPLQGTGKNKSTQGTNLFQIALGSTCSVINSKGEFLASSHVTKGSVFVNIHCLKTLKQKRLEYVHNKNISSIVFHPTEASFATGDDVGRIQLWRHVWDSEDIKTQEFHWHSSPVSDMAFSSTGETLWSVGAESVIVSWQLQTLDKTFIANLGYAIRFISVSDDDTELVTTLSNNKVKIISVASLKAVHELRGISRGSNRELGLKRDPRTNLLVLSGLPCGAIQFYNPDTDIVSQEADITGENFLSIPSKRHKVFDSKVEHVAFTHDGKWMITVESSKFQLIPLEIRLKFWCSNTTENRYDLHTVYEPPHPSQIRCVEARPRPDLSSVEYMIVATREDCCFNLWALSSEKSASPTWSVLHKCRYSNLTCDKASFSEDGSLLGVVFEQVITLWDPDKGRNLASLLSPVQDDGIRDICFCGKDSSQYLLAATSCYVLAWDLLSCTLCWSLKGDVKLMMADPFSKYVVLVDTDEQSNTTNIFYLDPSSSYPVAVIPDVTHKGSIITSAVFLPRIEKYDPIGPGILRETGRLFVLLDKQMILTFEPKKGVVEDQALMAYDDVDDQTDFIKVFGFQENAKKAMERKLLNSVQNLPSTTKVIKTIMAAPSHVLPPVDSLSAMLFKATLPKPKLNQGYTPAQDGTEDDKSDANDEISMDIDSDEEEEKDTEMTEVLESSNEHEKDDSKTKQTLPNLSQFDTTWLNTLFPSSSVPNG